IGAIHLFRVDSIPLQDVSHTSLVHDRKLHFSVSIQQQYIHHLYQNLSAGEYSASAKFNQ
ncbi:MAG: hypothetical protein AAFX51_18980, partial [Cyanobacteria bacterium J06636_28]